MNAFLTSTAPEDFEELDGETHDNFMNAVRWLINLNEEEDD